jgi:hypothetical protein
MISKRRVKLFSVLRHRRGKYPVSILQSRYIITAFANSACGTSLHNQPRISRTARHKFHPAIRDIPDWLFPYSHFKTLGILSGLRRLGSRAKAQPCQELNFGGQGMKALLVVGLLVLILGIISFVVPFPHMHHHGVSVGDAHIGVTTEHDEKIAPAVSIVLVVVGAGLIIAGRNS